MWVGCWQRSFPALLAALIAISGCGETNSVAVKKPPVTPAVEPSTAPNGDASTEGSKDPGSDKNPAPASASDGDSGEPNQLVGTGQIQLTDVSDSSGITFTHTDGSSGERYIVETVSAGLALFDYDLDGDIDIYFLNGSALQGTKFADPPTNALYRNDGDMHFTDVTAKSGAGNTGYGLGVAIGDYDSDGLPDIYLNNFGPNAMYRNNGDGTFSDTTEQTGTAGEANKVGAGTCFLDADGDGDLDLYVSNYIDFEFGDHTPHEHKGFHVYRGPFHYTPTPDVFYLNKGDGTFSDVSAERGISQHLGRGMGTVCFDFGQDGDTDIFVANDSSGNFLFENDGRGYFTEVGLLAGIAFDYKGETQGSMGVVCADFDNDQLLDLHVTSYEDEFPALYQNRGGGIFDEIALPANGGRAALQHVSWGNGFADFDNDGDRDIFIACGHLYDNVDSFSDTTSYWVRNILLENLGTGKFADVSTQAGSGLEPVFSSRGAAFDDLDNDGDTDAVILNSRSAPTVIRNDSTTGNHWLQIQLKGRSLNRDGVGARVTVKAGELIQIDEVHSGHGYESHYGSRLHFGLGKHERVDRIEVHWVGNPVPDIRVDVAVDQIFPIAEGAGSDAAN